MHSPSLNLLSTLDRIKYHQGKDDTDYLFVLPRNLASNSFLGFFDDFCIFGILMYDIVLKISFLELFEHFYFLTLLVSPENFDSVYAKLNVLENSRKKFW